MVIFHIQESVRIEIHTHTHTHTYTHTFFILRTDAHHTPMIRSVASRDARDFIAGIGDYSDVLNYAAIRRYDADAYTQVRSKGASICEIFRILYENSRGLRPEMHYIERANACFKRKSKAMAQFGLMWTGFKRDDGKVENVDHYHIHFVIGKLLQKSLSSADGEKGVSVGAMKVPSTSSKAKKHFRNLASQRYLETVLSNSPFSRNRSRET